MTSSPQRHRLALATALLLLCGGCASSAPKWIDQPWSPATGLSDASRGTKANSGVDSTPGEIAKTASAKVPQSVAKEAQPQESTVSRMAAHRQEGTTVVRGQDYGYGAPPPQTFGTQTGGAYVPPGGGGQVVVQQPQQGGYAPPQNYGAPYAVGGPGATQMPNPQIGAPNENSPFFQQPTGGFADPYNYADIDVMLQEAQTGRMTFGGAYNSNSGLVGQIIIDERNFDIRNFPRSFEDIINGTAWRGAGQGFRLELVPGNEVQRYAVNFDEPYLFNSQISFSASGYFFDRQYFDWSEQRLGGRVALGYRLTPDLSVTAGLRMEDVNIRDPRVNTSPSLNAALGGNSLYLASFSLINDTRDHPFMASDGAYLELAYHQGFGDFGYPRGDLDYRRYFLIYERPDGSGRHTLTLQTRLGVSGSSTPIFENYQAGGFSTLRGFSFRGASPVEGDVRVGGRFQWLNTVEYTFPITADDMFKGVLFCDYGTIENEVTIDGDNFRVAPGFGFRVHVPMGGAGGAPLAFDFAFPVADAATDDQQIFSFYMGMLR